LGFSWGKESTGDNACLKTDPEWGGRSKKKKGWTKKRERDPEDRAGRKKKIRVRPLFVLAKADRKRNRSRFCPLPKEKWRREKRTKWDSQL